MSTAVATETRRYTPEDLLAMPDGKNYELVNGRLVERNMGAESSWVGGQLHLQLGLFCREQDLGIVWPADNGYQCFPHNPRLPLPPARNPTAARASRRAGHHRHWPERARSGLSESAEIPVFLGEGGNSGRIGQSVLR